MRGMMRLSGERREKFDKPTVRTRISPEETASGTAAEQTAADGTVR